MKIPDHEIISHFFLITDQWKLDYERGIQVPVNENNLHTPNICYNPFSPKINPSQDLTPMPTKLISSYNLNIYKISSSNYDLDEIDSKWLQNINEHLAKMNEESLSAENFERLIELFERKSNENLTHFLDNLKNYNIEFDEAIVCDVCRSPDSECGNEMVFCDGCNVCVHQACYGIAHVPEGAWLCGPCAFGGTGFKPECLLCPNKVLF